MTQPPPIQDPPSPWKLVRRWIVGGLFQVGYAEGSDLLLVLSYDGRGVFDCLNGEKLARDYDDVYDFFDPIKLMAQGFDVLEGQKIRTGGSYGGGLPLTTEDGWGLREEAPAYPTRSILLELPESENESVVIGDDEVRELRAFGFSGTGLSFIIATSADLTIFSRPANELAGKKERKVRLRGLLF
jgi:hypothetical protein